MTPQQRAELDAKVASILANTEAKNGAPLDPIEEDAIMMAVAQQMQAQWAAEEKAQQQAQQQTQPASTGGVAGGALSALAGVEHTPVTPSAPVTIPTAVTGIPQNEQEWFEAQKAAQAVDRKTAETQQQRIDDYNRVSKPFLGISRLGGADYTNLDRYNRDIANRENLIIEDTRERNKQAKLANRAEFDKVANAVAQAEMERINANLPDNTQGVSLESVRNSMFPGYKPGHGEYSNEDLLSMLSGAKVPSDYIDAFNSKLTPYMSEEERIAQLNGKPAPKPTNTVGEIPQYSPEQFFNAPQPTQADASSTASNEPVTVNPVESDAIGGVGGTALGVADFATQAAKMVNGARQTMQPSVKGTRQNTIGVLAGEPAAQPARTTTTRATSPVARTTASTQQVVTQQPAQDTALQIGSRGSYIPSTGFTTPNNAGGAQITISPVEFGGDNGGLQYGAMNALYADPKRAPSLGELLAFSSIMQGKKDLGGLDTVTATMQSADKMNAYAAQQNIAGRMQQLMHGGASADEARYQAISEEMLRNGQGRGAAAITIPEYAKAADTQAARNLDTAMTAGGDYRANSAFGYTPLGIGSVTANSDGSYNMNVNGQRISGIAPEYARMSVYGAIKGDGSGSKLANDYDYKFNDKMYDTTVDSMKAETEAAKILYDLQRGKYGDASKMSPEEKIRFAYEYANSQERGKQDAREAAEHHKNQQTPTSGNKTGIDTKWF